MNNPKLTAQAAAEQMMAKVGFVVIGFPANSTSEFSVGERTCVFAGGWLRGHELMITGPSCREEWDAQVLVLFGDAGHDKNPRELGQRFYRCALLPEKVFA